MKPGALLLFPGAGSDRDHSSLRALDDAVSPRLAVERADFPYRKAGKKAPDRPPVLLESVRTEAAALVARAHIRAGRLVLGGRSMGGRICSMAVADGLPARGLVLLSYPLHPPGRPDRLRTEHLPNLDPPCLFIHGTRDPFGTPDEITEAAGSIPGAVTHVWIDGAGHDLRGADEQIVTEVTSWLAGLK